MFRCRRAASALEFGLIMPVIVTIVLTTFDLGSVVQQRIKLADAVRAGGQYAMSYPTDSTGIMNAIKTALPSGWTDVTVSTPVASCTCWSGNAETPSSCNANPICPSGQTAARYITLAVSRANAPLLITSLTATQAAYVARVQ